MPETPQKTLFDFIKAFFVPTVLSKIAVLYFGINYSQYPDHGYGYGLAASLIFTVVMLARFVFKYRHTEDI